MAEESGTPQGDPPAAADGAPSRTRSLVGSTVGRYQILDELGGGGMGVVYRAHDTQLNRTIALKFLPQFLSQDSDARSRFFAEARAASALDHANVCNVHEIGETEDGQIFIAMSAYDGETLKPKIARGRVPVALAIDYALQIARGLEKAHAQDIVHRDIKPANLMVTEDGVVKILDFGTAKTRDLALTQIGTSIGTVGYMSPEQAEGEDVDHRSDLWSLGAVLYEMLSGHQPFKGDRGVAVVYSILFEEPIPLIEHHPSIPDDVVAIVGRCLAKDREDRYGSAHELIADLEMATTRSGARLTTTRSRTDDGFRPSSVARRNWTRLAVAALALVAIVGIVSKSMGPPDVSASVNPMGIQPSDVWPDELQVERDTDVGIKVTGERDPVLDSLRISWRSTNEAVLKVVGNGTEASLIPEAPGVATVVVIVDGGAGLQAFEHRNTVVVRETWKNVALGVYHGCARATSDDRTYCWGSGGAGALGDGNVQGAVVPVAVASAIRFLEVSASGPDPMNRSHTCARTRAEAYCWGSFTDGQLGHGQAGCPQAAAIACLRPTPVRVASRANEVFAIATGSAHSCLAEAGESDRVYFACWGLGFGGAPVDVHTIGDAGSGAQARNQSLTIAAGAAHTCLGNDTDDSDVPMADYRARGIRCFGDNAGGQLGDGTFSDRGWPGALVLLADGTPLEVGRFPYRPGSGGINFENRVGTPFSAGGRHTCAIEAVSNELWCWGANDYGQLGVTGLHSSTVPVRAGGALAGASVLTVSAGTGHTCAIVDDGAGDRAGPAYCWGNNDFGQLGNGIGSPGRAISEGSTDMEDEPDAVKGSLRFKDVSAGWRHTCGITAEGALYCWGRSLTALSPSANYPLRVDDPGSQ